MGPRQLAVLVSVMLVVGPGAIGARVLPDDARLAQFGAVTKKRATPVPQRTAAPNTRQNVERRGAPSQPGGPFGGMRK
jgi:hypothetical protein